MAEGVIGLPPHAQLGCVSKVISEAVLHLEAFDVSAPEASLVASIMMTLQYYVKLKSIFNM